MKKGLLFAFLFVSGATVLAGPGVEVWRELQDIRPTARGVPVAGVVLVRDAFTFYLDSGAFFPLSEVAGRVVGGVFKGKCRFELKPATENERSFLALHSRQKDLRVLADAFENVVLLFTDGTGKELLSSPPSVAGDAEALAAAYNDALKRVDKNLHADLRLKLVPDLVDDGRSDGGLFMACFSDGKLPPALAVFSPSGLDETGLLSTIVGVTGAETTSLVVMDDEKGGIWYSEKPAAPAAAAPDAATDFEPIRYSIETTIRKNTDIEGRTTLRLRCGAARARVVPLDLFSKLRISEVRLKKNGDAEAGVVPFIQGDDKSWDPVLVVLPEALEPGEEAELTVDYKGDEVVEDTGIGTRFYVNARDNWYPVLNIWRGLAVYDLTYRVPKKWQVVSVGKLIGSSTDGDFAVYHFTSDRPVRVAGFNYGSFQLLEQDDKESGVKIRVYSCSDRHSMADSIMADSVNMARVGTFYFGPLPQNDIAVTQQMQFNYGQSWPTLVYIPFMAFLDWVTLAEARRIDEYGINDESEKAFVQEVAPHEFAHQWWGHTAGAATYRDVWLDEGLATFTVSLFVERAFGAKEFRNFWSRAQKDILRRPWRHLCTNDKAGPICLGTRLRTAETFFAYNGIVYSKGAFVVQMLRGLLRDPRNPDPDHRFIAMMKDYIAGWGGRNSSTSDFQAVVERHLGAKMDWFFRQWIEGTAVPKIESTIRVQPAAASGRYRLSGSVTQSEVPDDFRSVLPLYLEFDKGQRTRLAQLNITGNRSLPIEQEIRLPKKPVRVLINPSFEWLTR